MARKLWVRIAVVAAVIVVAGVVLIASFPTPQPSVEDNVLRLRSIPSDAVKIIPSHDQHPPVLHSSLWYGPVPLAGPINTAGAEDSPFILPDGSSLYFFFTPDVRKTPEQQLLDGVTGIWRSDRNDAGWSAPHRVHLQDSGKLALDGAPFILGSKMWFASAREGYTGVKLFTADQQGTQWLNWQYAGDLLNVNYQVGEMHITADGLEMYFHSARPGGKAGLDIWVTKNVGGQWQQPENVAAVNSAGNEGWPFVSQDGQELWFTRTYLGSPGLFRSLKEGGNWSEPELIVSSFAGEPTLDVQGNLYFVHHFYRDDAMLEADIYMAHKK